MLYLLPLISLFLPALPYLNPPPQCLHRSKRDSVVLFKSHAAFVSVCTYDCAFFCVSLILCAINGSVLLSCILYT